MALRPLTLEHPEEYQQYANPVVATPAPVVEEKSWGERIRNDIVDKVGNFFTGAQQGINEMGRAQDALYSGPGQPQPTAEQTQQNQQLVSDAQANFNNETALPVMAFNPATAIPAIAGMLYNGATETYKNTEGTPLEKAGNAVRAITYGPAQDMYNDPNLKQEFYDRPVSTLASGAMALGQAVLPLVGAKYGVKKAGNIKDELVAKVDSKLNEITDNPPLQNTGIQGLDALDQLDAPNQGFRAATKEELIANPDNSVVGALKNVLGQKFDDANSQSYMDWLKKQEDQSNVLQSQKNDIAGQMLFNGWDRTEVGADFPLKKSFGDINYNGKVLGEDIQPHNPNEIYLGDKPQPQEIIQEKQPRYSQPQERPFLPSAEQLIDERDINNIYRDNGIGKQQFSVLDKKELSRQIVQSVKD